MQVEAFERHRAMLLGIACRMLGSSSDAEDAVQDAWLRWQAADNTNVRDERAFLATTVSRLCIDRLTSARARRESYVGPWLPEPVRTSSEIDPETLCLAFLVALERLTPVERAALIPHRVFEYSHHEIASLLNLTEHASRQALFRAAQHLAVETPRFRADPSHHRRLASAFLAAVRSGDLSRITELLTKDATLRADGGGKISGAATRPVVGAVAVARFLLGLAARFPASAIGAEEQVINGEWALVLSFNQVVISVMAFETDGQRISGIRNVVNPEKLGLRTLSL